MLPIIVAFCIGLLIGVVALTMFGSTWVKRAQKEADRIRELAQREREIEIKDTRNKLQTELDKGKAQIEDERKKRVADLDEKVESLKKKSHALDKTKATLDTREASLSEKEEALEAARYDAVKLERLYKMKLHRITGISHEDAKSELLQVEEILDQIEPLYR